MYRNANTYQIQIRDTPSLYIIDVSPKTWRWALRMSVSYSRKSADTSQPYNPLCFGIFDQVDEINNTDDTKDTFQMIPQIKLRRSSFSIKLNKKAPWKKSDGGESNNELAICEVSCRQVSIYVSIPASLYNVFEHFKINLQLCVLKYDNFSNDYFIINLQVCI